MRSTGIEEMLGYSLVGLIPAAPDLAFHSTKEKAPMIVAGHDSFAARQHRTIAEDLIEAL